MSFNIISINEYRILYRLSRGEKTRSGCRSDGMCIVAIITLSYQPGTEMF